MATAMLEMPRALAEAPTSDAPARRRWFGRFMDALMQSRMRRAEEEVRRYRHLVPEELECAAARLTSRTEDQLPFIR